MMRVKSINQNPIEVMNESSRYQSKNICKKRKSSVQSCFSLKETFDNHDGLNQSLKKIKKGKPPHSPRKSLSTVSEKNKEKYNLSVVSLSAANFSLFNRYMFCSICKTHFDLDQHMPVVASCENDYCLKCVKSLNFKGPQCQLCEKIHINNKEDYLLSLVIIRLLKDINNDKQKEFEEKLKKKLDVMDHELDSSLSKFDIVKTQKLDLFNRYNSESIERFDTVINIINNCKNKYIKDYQDSLDHLNSYFNETTKDLSQLLKNLLKEMRSIKVESEFNEINSKYKSHLKKYEDLLKDLGLNADILFESFKKKHDLDINTEIFKNPEKFLSTINQTQHQETIIDESPKDLNNHFIPLDQGLFFDYSQDKYDLNITNFILLDENRNLIDQIELNYSIDHLKLIGTNIEKTNFFIYFNYKNKMPNEYLIIIYCDKKLTHKLIKTPRSLLSVDSNHFLLFSERKKTIFGVSHDNDKEFEVKETSNFRLESENFKILGSSEKNIYVFQDNKIKIINKRSNGFINEIDLEDYGSNIIVKLNLDYDLVLINKSTKLIKIINPENGQVLESHPLKVSNDFENVYLTFKNKLFFIKFCPELSLEIF